jgi:hypothetical protein
VAGSAGAAGLVPRPRLGEKPMTTAERQARRRGQFRKMLTALERIRDEAKTVREAREIAASAIST